ncbi:Inner membrane protein YhaI [Tsuneonella dongtanensis]|uniref:Inner membrane protein YhaI n=1 Tax=Tsuneonella dongtanensis TaxID=692370 RepID=A0A1B2AC86_9SPHN|nr:DUF805 domain-containing protein [Tsuneonella dongtanensis]ANY19766.1 Inner membrane protein YhaI [Tsuneonella dongtanensis]
MTENPTWRGWMLRPLRHYADFRGRSGRREFWWYCLFLVLGYFAIFAVGVIAAGSGAGESSIGLVLMGGWGLFFLANFVPGLALTTRRLHDIGLSGVLLLAVFAALIFLNILGWLGYFVAMGLPGQRTENRWGPPLGAREVADVFA